MALRYLESKTIRTLKRTLREILGPITENIATKTQDNELKVPDIDVITMPSPNVII